MALLGWWIDKTLNTSPIFIIVLSIFGILAGMVSFLRTVMNISKKDKGTKRD